MMLFILAIELNIPVELGMRFLLRFLMSGDGDGNPDTAWRMSLDVATLIDGEFAAATLMISFGALIGTTSPLQIILICSSKSVFYALNKVVFLSPAS